MLIEQLKRLVREPLFHFLLIGAAVYALYGVYADSEDTQSELSITVTVREIQSLADQWQRLWNRPPTKNELDGVIRSHVRTKILYREAIAMGLDQGDTVMERRLAQKVEFMAQSLIVPEEPVDEELQAWYAANLSQFKAPDLYSITHIFFNPDTREQSTQEDARAALVALKALDEMPADYDDYGDQFMLQSYYQARSELQLRKIFGSVFVDQVVGLEPGVWQGPVLSGYGSHLVMINDVVISPVPPFKTVRKRIRDQWMQEEVKNLSERFVNNLISRYEVVIEESAASPANPAMDDAQ